MRTINQTIGYDKDLMFIVKIDMEGSYFYFNDLVDDLVLDAVHFDGKVLLKKSLSSFKKDIDCINGGTIGQAGYGSFSVSRYNQYTGLSNFHKDIYPSTSKPNLTSKKVDIGFVWVGASTLAEVTWVWKGTIWFWQYNDAWIEIQCREFMEVEGKQLPPFKIQKDEPDGLSYFLNAPDENYGVTIPIVYGDFSLENLEYSTYNLTPAIRTHKTDNNYIMACHLCHTVDSQYLFKYLDGAKTVMKLSGVTYSGSNSRKGYILSLSTNGSIITGELLLQFGASISAGLFAGITGEAFDKDSTTFAVVTGATTLALKLISTLSESGVGLIPYSANNVIFKARFRSESGTVTGKMEWYDSYYGNNDVTKLSGVNVSNELAFSINTSETISAFSFGTNSYVTGWKIEDLQNNYCCLTNVSANLRLINAHLYISNIQVYDKRYSKWIPQYIKTPFASIPAAPREIRDYNPVDFGNGAMFSKIKGSIYDYWIQ